MLPRSFTVLAVLLASATLAGSPATYAWSNGGGSSSCGCQSGGGHNTSHGGGKNINVYKPVTINKNINVYKPVTINKNIDISKNITIEKNITINKGGSGSASASASATASAYAQAMANAQSSANASATNNATVYGGGSYEYVTVNNHSGEISGIHVEEQCHMQQANVVKAIHAVCVAPDGREFPASHMAADTWVQSSYEGELMRCIPGAHLKVTIGDVVQSDQGMAGTYANGRVLECAENEALRHYKDGMVKCAPKVPVPDCTERTNLRRYGTGDMFFSYGASVCVNTSAAERETRELDVTGMTLDGGVGDDSGN
jgi:acetyltransferase-like isoleucine patch superfamily enzyme